MAAMTYSEYSALSDDERKTMFDNSSTEDRGKIWDMIIANDTNNKSMLDRVSEWGDDVWNGLWDKDSGNETVAKAKATLLSPEETLMQQPVLPPNSIPDDENAEIELTKSLDKILKDVDKTGALNGLEYIYNENSFDTENPEEPYPIFLGQTSRLLTQAHSVPGFAKENPRLIKALENVLANKNSSPAEKMSAAEIAEVEADLAKKLSVWRNLPQNIGKNISQGINKVSQFWDELTASKPTIPNSTPVPTINAAQQKLFSGTNIISKPDISALANFRGTGGYQSIDHPAMNITGPSSSIVKPIDQAPIDRRGARLIEEMGQGALPTKQNMGQNSLSTDIRIPRVIKELDQNNPKALSLVDSTPIKIPSQSPSLVDSTPIKIPSRVPSLVDSTPIAPQRKVTGTTGLENRRGFNPNSYDSKYNPELLDQIDRYRLQDKLITAYNQRGDMYPPQASNKAGGYQSVDHVPPIVTGNGIQPIAGHPSAIKGTVPLPNYSIPQPRSIDRNNPNAAPQRPGYKVVKDGNNNPVKSRNGFMWSKDYQHKMWEN